MKHWCLVETRFLQGANIEQVIKEGYGKSGKKFVETVSKDEVGTIAKNILDDYDLSNLEGIKAFKEKVGMDGFLKIVREKAIYRKILGSISNISQKIANGHAFTKHIQEFKSFGITTSQGLQDNTVRIMKRASGTENAKFGEKGRVAYWDDGQKAIVIYDPTHVDLGTTFIPVDGKSYFYNFK